MKNRLTLLTGLLIAACSSTRLVGPADSGVFANGIRVKPDSVGGSLKLIPDKRPADYGMKANRPARPRQPPIADPATAPRSVAAVSSPATRLPATEAAKRAEMKVQLKAVDSLVMQLQSMNRVDSVKHSLKPMGTGPARPLTASAAQPARPRKPARPRPLLRPHTPNTLPKQDTLYVDTLGVKLALWIGPNGVAMNVIRGVVKKDALPVQGTAVKIQPGFDWQHDGWLVAAGGVIGLCLIIFTYNKTKCKNAGIPENV